MKSERERQRQREQNRSGTNDHAIQKKKQQGKQQKCKNKIQQSTAKVQKQKYNREHSKSAALSHTECVLSIDLCTECVLLQQGAQQKCSAIEWQRQVTAVYMLRQASATIAIGLLYYRDRSLFLLYTLFSVHEFGSACVRHFVKFTTTLQKSRDYVFVFSSNNLGNQTLVAVGGVPRGLLRHCTCVCVCAHA